MIAITLIIAALIIAALAALTVAARAADEELNDIMTKADDAGMTVEEYVAAETQTASIIWRTK